MIYRAENNIRVWEKVMLNNKDVTSECFYVDTDKKIIKLYKRNEEGKFYIDQKTWNATEEIINYKDGELIIEFKMEFSEKINKPQDKLMEE